MPDTSLLLRANRPFYLQSFIWLSASIVLAITFVLTGCTSIDPTPTPAPTATPMSSVPNATSNSSSGSFSTAGLPSIADLVDRVELAVVSIQVEVIERGFFGPVRSIGSGSGVIFRKDGYILTNYHVIENADKIQVSLFDGRDLEAEVVGDDVSTDLAVLKVAEGGLSTIPLGDASTLRVGDWVIAIGNALGLEGGPTVTVGVVSALERSIQAGPGITLVDLIQTDAAINRGNSGGPLINLQGEVIGINTAVLRGPTSDAQGIGFAVSTTTAIPIAEQLVINGRVTRPYLGIYPSDIDFATVAEMDLAVREGVVVTDVVPGGPAERAGIRMEDVIVALDGHLTPNFLALHHLMLGQFKVGQRITVTVFRGEDRREFSIILGEFPG